MLPIRLRHFWICKKSPVVRGKHAGAQQRDYGLQLWWLVSNSGVTGFSVQGLQRPPYTLPRHRLLTCASTYAFTTTLNHFATVVMFHNITPVTYGLPVSKIGPPHSMVTTGKSTGFTLTFVIPHTIEWRPCMLRNALTCCIGRTATVTNRIRAYLATHSGYPLMLFD